MPPPSTVFAHVLIRGVFCDGDCLPAVGSEGGFIAFYLYLFLLLFIFIFSFRRCGQGVLEGTTREDYFSLLLFIFILFIFFFLAFFKGK